MRLFLFQMPREVLLFNFLHHVSKMVNRHHFVIVNRYTRINGPSKQQCCLGLKAWLSAGGGGGGEARPHITPGQDCFVELSDALLIAVTVMLKSKKQK